MTIQFKQRNLSSRDDYSSHVARQSNLKCLGEIKQNGGF